MFRQYNPNPEQRLVGDCVIRAISFVLEQDWERTYLDLCIEGLVHHDMPSANSVWGAYLKSKGFMREILPNTCPDCYTVLDFCEEYPEGTYLLATGTHVIAVKDGDYYDAWDSGKEVPVYYWRKEE